MYFILGLLWFLGAQAVYEVVKPLQKSKFDLFTDLFACALWPFMMFFAAVKVAFGGLLDKY